MRETLADATYSDGGHDGRAMDVSCPKCERRLWAEKVSVAESFSVWVFFDNEERSDTYAEPFGHCPECGAWLTEGGGWPTRSVREGHLKRNVQGLVGVTSATLKLPEGYRLDLLTDPDAPALRRPDGTVVARFATRGLAREPIEREALKDLLSESRGQGELQL